MNIVISAIICTHNRASYLIKAIKSLVNQTLDKSLYEIIVIDNDSTDDTKRITLKDFANVSNLKYIYEPVLGLSQARNTGWKNAKGKYVAYLDDDAIADSQWLAIIQQVFETVQPTPGIVGGKVDPIWERPRPIWLPDMLLGDLSIVDWSDVATTLNETQWLAGTNIAFPRNILKAAGGFQINLGRKGNKLLSMEEILLRRQIEANGYNCYYHPNIAVFHHIPSSRLTKQWFIRRRYWQGISVAIDQILWESLSTRKRIGKALIARRKIFSSRRLVNLASPTSDPTLFALKCDTVLWIGYILGMLGLIK